MSDEQNSNSTTDSEEVEATENELIRLQMDEWLEICMEDMFSNLTKDDLTEADETEGPLGECNITRDQVGKEAE
jgi:hypothetical protein